MAAGVSLGGWPTVRGTTLQEAADELVRACSRGACRARGPISPARSPSLPELHLVEFLHDVAAWPRQGGDVRRLVLSGERARAA